MFCIEPLHNLHLGVYKLIKECTCKYLSSDGVLKHPGRAMGHRLSLSRVRLSTSCQLFACCTSLGAVVAELHVVFSSRDVPRSYMGFSKKVGFVICLKGRAIVLWIHFSEYRRLYQP